MNKTNLARVFKSLRNSGIYARMNFSCCGSCGHYEIKEILKAKDPEGRKYKGYCFYDAQENDRSNRRNDCLYLQHGWHGKIIPPVSPGPYAHRNVCLSIVELLQRNGLKCEWEGNEHKCIKVILS